MDNMMAKEKLAAFFSATWCVFTTVITDKAIGNIIIVVAVLLNHMLINPVEIIKPNIIRSPLVPVYFTIVNAIRLCRFHFSMAIPIIKPPRNKNITSLA